MNTQTISLKNNYKINGVFKDTSIYLNNINLNAVIKILNNRFDVVFLRRNDRVDYNISKDKSSLTQEKVTSIYHIFIEKI